MTIVAGDTPDWLPDSSASVDNIVKLQTFTLNTGGQAQFTETLTVGKSYKSLYLIFFAPLHTGVYTVTVSAKDAAANIYWAQTYSWSLLALGIRRFAVPVPCTAGGLLSVFVAGGTLNDTVQMALYGGTDQVVGSGPLYRPDGRLYAFGGNAFHGTNAAGETLISAPGAGSRILLASLDIMCQCPAAGAAFYFVQGIVNGTTFHIATAGGAANQIEIAQAVLPAGGLLLDDNTALVSNQAGSPSAVFADGTYDEVF